MNQVKLSWHSLSKIISFRGSGVKDFTGNVEGKLKPYGLSIMGLLGFEQNAKIVTQRFGSNIRNENDVDHRLTREFLAKAWVADGKAKNSRRKKRSRIIECVSDGEQSVLQYPRWFSRSSVKEDSSMAKGKRVLKQPPLSQFVSDFLDPEGPEEAKVAPLLARSNLLITRDIEWANLAFGFEQENRYAIVDVCYPQSPVGFIREQSNVIARQFLRTRRPFVAYITDALGNELFKVRRPFWWITSSIYAEINGKEIGVVHRRWHLWRRIYDLYLGYACSNVAIVYIYYFGQRLAGHSLVNKFSVIPFLFIEYDPEDLTSYGQNLKFNNCIASDYCLKCKSQKQKNGRNEQFAVVENPGLWNWTFTLKDINGEVLANIDRDWRGFGFEILTDAGQYVIQFGTSDPSSKTGPARAIHDLEVVRPLTLSERAVAVALAISLDNDYFSRRRGWALPFIAVEEI